MHITLNPVEGEPHSAPAPAPEDVLDEGQFKRGCDSPVIEEQVIDNITLGAPFDEGSSTTRTQAGCVWSEEDWSCAYDAVFMSLLSIYEGSSPGWRNEWREQSPRWSNLLGAAFDSLLATSHAQPSQAVLSQEFTSFREIFRDELSRINPLCFRRHGAVPASVCQILNHIFGGSVEREPCLNQLVACDQCGISVYDRCSFTLLGSTELLSGYLREGDIGPPLPLQIAVTRYIQRFSQEPGRSHCRTCSGPLNVESLSFPDMPWLWIELCDPVSPITPSLRLVFGLPDQRQVYTLQAVIYLGGNHFTARLSDQSATWWKYDGRWRFGAPRIDDIRGEADLLKNDGRRAAFLLYRRADPQD